MFKPKTEDYSQIKNLKPQTIMIKTKINKQIILIMLRQSKKNWVISSYYNNLWESYQIKNNLEKILKTKVQQSKE